MGTRQLLIREVHSAKAEQALPLLAEHSRVIIQRLLQGVVGALPATAIRDIKCSLSQVLFAYAVNLPDAFQVCEW